MVRGVLQVRDGAGGVLTHLWYVVYCRYVTVLVELTRIEGTRHGRLIAAQLLDVAIRVQAVRAFVVVRMVCCTLLSRDSRITSSESGS